MILIFVLKIECTFSFDILFHEAKVELMLYLTHNLLGIGYR